MSETPKLKMRSFSPWILEAWATWETMRKLDFKPDEIFWVFANTENAIPRPGITLNIMLKAQNKQMVVTCSHRLSEGEARRLERSAREFQEALSANRFDEAEATQVLLKSFVWVNKADFLMTLRQKGFEFPFKLNAMN